jgi:hypothetical protein
MNLSGRLIASGFDETERDAVIDALRVRPEALLVEDSWVGVIARP